MRVSRRWWGIGIAVVAVIAMFLLSMVVPASSVASAGAPVKATGSGGITAAVTAAMTTANPKAAASAHPMASGGPHPGKLEIYEIAPDGQTSEDPAVAYDTVSYEPILNVYQTLVAYNGSSSATFVPELSTCVPGLANGADSSPSVSCASKYSGNSLIVNGTYFTYPIDPAAHFYDPATGASWPVFPSDVVYSLARTMGFANLPGPGVLNGWIQTQALTQFGNPKWDNGIHFPFNNTPQGILSSFIVNSSYFCPASALAQNGCITFNASGEGAVWPFFNELVADPLGAGVVPCGWFYAQGATVPGFTGSKAANGDGPCLLPGGSMSTSQSGYQNYITSTLPTAWDSFELLANNHPEVQPSVQFNLVGSGPYYIAPGQDQKTVGYTLQANPAYQQPTGCVGVGGGCEPAVGGYASTVVVQYESTDTEGVQQYEAGQADAAGILGTDTAVMLQLEAQGKIGILYSPTISTFFLPYDLDFNLTGANGIGNDANNLNVPSDFFASNTVRGFLNHAWPYTTIANTLWTTDGVSYGFNFGGAIPNGMGNYYPSNVSWPYLGGDPGSNTSIGSAAWWWTQGTTVGSPYYDSELAACSSSSPCKFPVIGELGAPLLDAAIALFISSIESISHNALQPYSFDLSFPDLVQYSGQPPGDNPMPFFNLGWAPDYPDPTDYMAAMYYANGTYTNGDATYQVLEENATYNAAYCGHSSGSWADLVYWANFGSANSTAAGAPIPVHCQGPAYGAMLTWMGNAASLPVGSYRTLIYNEVEHIENQLGFYLWYEQANSVDTYAKWINPATINVNVMIGGGGDQTWYLWSYEPATSTVTVSETGLASGVSWGLTYAGTLYTSTGTSLSIPYQTNGSYQYSMSYVPGYTITTGATNGTVVVTVPNSPTISVTFTSFTGGSALGFQEIGLKSGIPWTVVVQGVGSITSNATSSTFTLPAATYSYAVGLQPGYTVSPASGSGTPGGSVVTFVYTGIGSFATYPITITSKGLAGASWTASVGGWQNTTTSSSVIYWEPNGSSYPISAVSSTTLTPEYFPANVSVTGAAASALIYWYVSGVPAKYTVTFSSSTALTSAWTISLNGLSNGNLTGGPITFTGLVNGSYTYAVITVPTGFTAQGGTVTVAGAAVAQTVKVSSSSGTGVTQYNNKTSVPTWAYAVIGVFVVLTLVFLVTTIMARRKPPTPPAPQSWTPGTGQSGEGQNPPPPSS